jgi:hypothetical protein
MADDGLHARPAERPLAAVHSVAIRVHLWFTRRRRAATFYASLTGAIDKGASARASARSSISTGR